MLTLDFETLEAFFSASAFPHLFSSSYIPNPKEGKEHKINKHKNIYKKKKKKT